MGATSCHPGPDHVDHRGGPIRGESVFHWGQHPAGSAMIFPECGVGNERLACDGFVEMAFGDRVCAKCRWPEEYSQWFEADERLDAVGITRLYYRPRPVLVRDGQPPAAHDG